jgi:hypothetical protein
MQESYGFCVDDKREKKSTGSKSYRDHLFMQFRLSITSFRRLNPDLAASNPPFPNFRFSVEGREPLLLPDTHEGRDVASGTFTSARLLYFFASRSISAKIVASGSAIFPSRDASAPFSFLE